MEYIVLLLVVLQIIAVIYIFLLRSNQRYINKQLDYIIKHQTNANLLTNLNDNPTKEMLHLINQTIEQKKEIESKSIILEKNLRSLINNVTHDLRTPLTVAKGYLQMADKEELSDDMKQSYIKKTNDSLNRLSERINILFEYTKIQEQKDKYEFVKLNISSILEEQILLFYQQFSDQQFKVSIDIEKNITMYGHLASIKSIFQNVLDNTLKHGQEEISILLKKQNQTILFECINKTNRDSIDTNAIFERFYTEDMSRNNQNTGLGMPIIKDLAMIHFGNVKVNFENHIFDLTILFKII